MGLVVKLFIEDTKKELNVVITNYNSETMLEEKTVLDIIVPVSSLHSQYYFKLNTQYMRRTPRINIYNLIELPLTWYDIVRFQMFKQLNVESTNKVSDIDDYSEDFFGEESGNTSNIDDGAEFGYEELHRIGRSILVSSTDKEQVSFTPKFPREIRV